MNRVYAGTNVGTGAVAATENIRSYALAKSCIALVTSSTSLAEGTQ